VAVFSYADLLFNPGSKYDYSTFGSNLAGAVVDAVAPGGYVNWIENSIANKTGMTSLTAYSSSPKGYDKNCQGTLSGKDEGSVTWKLPGGGWASNIKDLTKFTQGMINGKYLKNTSAMWQSVPRAEDENYHYGVNKHGSGNTLRISHGGAHSDVRTQMLFYPSQKFGIAIMINGGGYVTVDRISQRIRKALGIQNFSVNTDPRNYCDKDDGKLVSPCGPSYTGVWRKTNKDVIVRRGYGHDAFYTEWKRLRDAGYKCVDFDTYKQGSSRRWDGVFKKQSGSAAMWRGFDHSGFANKWREMNKDGYRLIDLETYKSGTKRKWAGLFVKGSGKYAMFRNLSTEAFGNKRKELAKTGLKLIDVEAYKSGNKLLWAGVWRAGNDGALYRNYATNAFRDLRRKQRDKGWKLIDVETYMDGNTRKWAGIWEKSSAQEKYLYGFKYCELQEKHKEYLADGFELIDVDRY
jgi:hypothetical protein